MLIRHVRIICAREQHRERSVDDLDLARGRSAWVDMYWSAVYEMEVTMLSYLRWKARPDALCLSIKSVFSPRGPSYHVTYATVPQPF